MNTRRQFLIRAPLGFLAARRLPQRQGAAPSQSTQPACDIATPGAPPTFGTGAGSGPDVTAATFAEAEKLMQVTMTPAERQQAADSWRQSLAPYLERRTGPRKVAIAATDAPATLWNPMLPGHGAGAVARSVRPVEGRRRAAAVIGRRDRLRAGDATVEMDRVAAAHVRAAYEYLSQSHRAAGSEDPIGHHADQGSRARAREGGRRRDRRRQIPRSAARHPVRRERSARHEGHSDDLRRRAVPQPRALGGLRGRAQAERRRRGAGGQALARRARAQRHLVRRPDDEPVAAGRGRVRIERRARSGDGRGAGRASPSAARPAAASSAPRCAAA